MYGKFFGYLGHLALGGPGRQGCPRPALHEDVTQPGSPQKECGECARISRMPVSVQDRRAEKVVFSSSGVPLGHHPARAVSPSGCSENMETSIGHRHD
jgi:hypothetical protein